MPLKLSTIVSFPALEEKISLEDDITLLGSCFVDNISSKLQDAGFKVHSNPFGTLYNPASIAKAIRMLDGDCLFEEKDCVKMGAGVDKFCSFAHHTSFARPTKEEFLENANASLTKAREDWHKSKWVIITLGTAFVWTHGGELVSNCLKRPGTEFEHYMLPLSEIEKYLNGIVENHKEKRIIFTVSPIRHLGDGAHPNTLSKSLLHLGINATGANYFPAYEILLDQLRDYRFYTDDLVHPSTLAVEVIWQSFEEYALREDEKEKIGQNERISRASKHVRRT